MTRRCALSVLAALTLAGATMAATAAQPIRHQRLTLLHTSDLHGNVLAVDDLREAPARGSLAQVATAVARLRRELDHPVLLFDSGDAIQGTPLEQLAHVRWGEPSPTIDAMNRIGYQAMAVGNHEFNFGRELLASAERQANFPFLSASIVEEATGAPAFTPYVILQAGALRVGVLGLTTPAIPGWEYPEHYRGLRFEPPDRAARRWLPLLERQGCDLVVVLAHTGFERDLASGRERPTAFEDFGWRLAQLGGIDVLLLGHTHEEISPRRIGTTIVAQPGARAEALTRLDLELEEGKAGWRIVSFHGSNLPMRGEEPDPVLTTALEPLHRRVVAALAGDVGEVTGPLSVHGCRLADCAASDLIHAVQLEASGAELSLTGILSDRTPDLAPGLVPRRWVDALYVYPNTLTEVRVTGAQVKDLLEHAARYYNGLDCSSPGRCVVAVDRTIPPYNVDSMQGVSYRVDPNRPEGERVLDLTWHGQPLDPARSFTLACNSYRAVGGGGYPHLATAEVVWRSTEELTDLIASFLERHRPWRPVADGNWALVVPPGQEATPLSAAR